jgi:hypothetical protein
MKRVADNGIDGPIRRKVPSLPPFALSVRMLAFDIFHCVDQFTIPGFDHHALSAYYSSPTTPEHSTGFVQVLEYYPLLSGHSTERACQDDSHHLRGSGTGILPAVR